MKNIKILIPILILLLVGCESLEDTYSDYSGPKKRYVGRAHNLEIETGWKRLRVKWENSLDSSRDSIKVIWRADEVADSVMLAPNITEYTTEQNLENKTYEVQVVAMDELKNESLDAIVYAKPFTSEHELIKSIGRVEKKYFFNNNSLILFFPESVERILESRLNYSDVSTGEDVNLILTKEILESKYYLINNVDPNKAVQIISQMNTAECFDVIDFEPYELDKDNKSFSADFLTSLKEFNDMKTISNEFINNLEVLYLDYSLGSLEDVLYFPNLKQIVFGANRFLDEEHLTYDDGAALSVVNDVSASVYALNTLNEINENLKVVSYNGQYIYLVEGYWSSTPYPIADELDFELTDGGNPVLPEIQWYEDMEGWNVSCNTDLTDNFNSKSENILKLENVDMVWKPRETEGLLREHQIIIDMNDVKEITGFYFRQPKGWNFESDYFIDNIQIFVSDNGHTYTKAFNNNIREVGMGEGEITLINLKEKINTRYVKLVVKDKVSNGNKYTYISKFIPFK